MSKKRLVVYDDQLLVDFELIFKAIRDEGGDWEKVEKEMREWLVGVQEMAGTEEVSLLTGGGAVVDRWWVRWVKLGLILDWARV